MMRRTPIWPCAFLALLAVAARPACAQPKQPQGPFADVPVPHWAEDAINELAALGIFNGYPDQTFSGKRAVTRYELAVAFQRILQDPLHRRASSPRTGTGLSKNGRGIGLPDAPVRLNPPEWHAHPFQPSPFHRLAASFSTTLPPLPGR
jgi:hypothetical protein